MKARKMERILSLLLTDPYEKKYHIFDFISF